MLLLPLHLGQRGAFIMSCPWPGFFLLVSVTSVKSGLSVDPQSHGLEHSIKAGSFSGLSHSCSHAARALLLWPHKQGLVSS